MRLKAGDAAVDFPSADIEGRPVSLADYTGRYLLLSFYRFASCPFCNLRVQEMSRRHAEFQRQGLEMVAVFQSPPESIRKYVGRQAPPFPIIADPDRALYKTYGVEASWRGMAKGTVVRIPDLLRAVFSEGFLPGSIEGEIQRLPADFLIDPDGRLRIAYYGRDIGDHLPLERLGQELTIE